MKIKLMIEEILQKIDIFFKEKSKKDVYILYMIVTIILFFLAYPFYDLSFNEFNSTKENVADIKTKINADEIYLKVNTEAVVSKLMQEIKQYEDEILVQREKNRYIKEKIEAISYLIYNEKAWGEYLNSISINAKKNNIKIINFANKYSQNNNSSFGHVLDISLEIKGSYLDTLKFINSLEQSELVVDIHDLSIKAQDSLNTDLNISVWGITY
ncbi:MULTISPECIES: type 4a pilus biogenesis protein PilO [unclassified Sulfurimonas]|uniref:type 4a pilus biogenesis protein PilO n=1 Tax=unclassified Sulfurimonas TaxID=2623549 RepID=UPI000AAF0BBB|nr:MULTISPECIES: type 4a pilus biogenesis protein PilO [unclassified Sulfurimonas]